MVPITTFIQILAETVWKGFRGVSLWEDMHHWEQALKSQKPVLTQVSFFCLVVVSQDEGSQLLPQGHARLCAVVFPSMMVMGSAL